MSEYIKLTQINPRSTIFVKSRQISSFVETGYNDERQVGMMGGMVFSVVESVDTIKDLLGIKV